MDVRNSGEVFYIELDDGESAELAYHVEGGALYLDSTYTPDAFRGRGIGGRLIEAAVAYAKEKGLKIVPVCSFAAGYFKRHPEYNYLLKK
ncbi:MAG: GNAT family N-acetyltransferase [Candidatus Verstraetearchaeota archaeon]|nr:GNAT family N-acetyltransferase [Candidatus Verstraetearchaeota archaeon]